MMSDMGHPPRHALPARPVRAAAVVAARVGAWVGVAVLAGGCSTAGAPEDDGTPDAESAALRVETVSGAERLDEQTRTELEGAVGDVLSDYVVEAFLGPFPREEFVQSFGSFTSQAARTAARDIDRLTAASAADATAVRATRLDARLSFLTRSGTAYAGTAAVDFAFEATMDDGSTRELVLDGRIMMEAESDTWRIFGYDVSFDDGVGTDAEAESAAEPEVGR
ncbi:hypothetical protein ASC64_13515 [Nocardioides sp. Root122]|nr:hypothetical protein ASC64_13515 [Nocardioides sp. Root122]